jgi:hypothetical protein
MSRAALIRLAVSILVFAAIVLVSPYLYAMAHWVIHREIAFEGDVIRVPPPWVSGQSGHLFSVQRPALTLFAEASESTITIDNFGEHWHADELDSASQFWLHAHGDPIRGIVMAEKAQVPSDLNCVSPDLNGPGQIYIRIDCLSSDSVHSYTFFGAAYDVPSFFDIATQAVRIGNKHPGRVFRP